MGSRGVEGSYVCKLHGGCPVAGAGFFSGDSYAKRDNARGKVHARHPKLAERYAGRCVNSEFYRWVFHHDVSLPGFSSCVGCKLPIFILAVLRGFSPCLRGKLQI